MNWILGGLAALVTIEAFGLAYLIKRVRRVLKAFETIEKDAESDLARIDHLYIEARKRLEER